MYGFRSQFAAQLMLILMGIGWCVISLWKLPDDWEEFRATKVGDVRVALVTSWVITAVVAFALVYCTPGFVHRYLRLLN